MDVDIRIPRVTKKQCHRANAQPQSTDLSEFYHVITTNIHRGTMFVIDYKTKSYFVPYQK